jgi:copper resistance protein B
MNTLRLACVAALAAVLPLGGASAQQLSGEIDLLELHTDLDETNFAIDTTFELRQNSHGVVLKAAGNGDIGPTMDELQTQALFLQQIAPSTAVHVGVRNDFRPGSDLTYASVAVTHDFADWLSGETFAYLSEDGDLTCSGEIVATIDLAEDLTLEPRVELLWSAQDVAREGFGAGPIQFSAAVRLRRALTERLDAYVGIVHERLLSDTRMMARAAGDSLQATRGLIGVGIEF